MFTKHKQIEPIFLHLSLSNFNFKICNNDKSTNFALPSSDQPSEVQHGGSDVPRPDLQLLPQRLVGGASQEAVCGRVGLPVETQNHQDGLRHETATGNTCGRS